VHHTLARNYLTAGGDTNRRPVDEAIRQAAVEALTCIDAALSARSAAEATRQLGAAETWVTHVALMVDAPTRHANSLPDVTNTAAAVSDTV
jgi:hypothetical protein